MKTSRIPLGEILVRRALITAAELEQALALQRRRGARLGDILIALGFMRYDALYKAVAESEDLPFVNLLAQPPEEGLPQVAHREDYLQLRLIPWRREGRTVVVAVCDLSIEVMLWLRQHYSIHTRLVITSPLDISRTVMQLFGTQIEEDSRLKLWQDKPDASARHTLLPAQKRKALAYAACGIGGLAYFPIESALAMTMFCHVAYTATMVFKCAIFAVGAYYKTDTSWSWRLTQLDEPSLPIYTILVPMYREAESLSGLLEAMRELDYPAAKLDIKLVLEEDDTQMVEAAIALKPSYQFDIIRVPAGEPRTKPKACNYALRFARGEYLTIYDADDRPDRDQLKKAVYLFRTLPDDVVCVQARLNYYNRHDNLLTQFFCLEYRVLFAVMLAGLERLRIPIPLGGTSNHIDFRRLMELGAWDPFNVTEDADLGARIAARGLRTMMLDSDTMEEAPTHVRPWIRQRSRWIKGYMQTWLVHMRNPVRLYRTLGARSFWGFQFFVGFSTFTFLTAPLVWGMALLWLFSGSGSFLPAWLLWLAVINLVLNIGSNWVFTLYCSYSKEDGCALYKAALLFPLYLILHSLASYKALWQLIVNPHYWEKTTHGISQKMRLRP